MSARGHERPGGDGAGAPPPPAAPDPDLLARRQRLIERFALMQSELGGLFYEMAIRDHVELDLLAARAAALQRVDLELAELERQISGEARSDRPATVFEPVNDQARAG